MYSNCIVYIYQKCKNKLKCSVEIVLSLKLWVVEWRTLSENSELVSIIERLQWEIDIYDYFWCRVTQLSFYMFYMFYSFVNKSGSGHRKLCVCVAKSQCSIGTYTTLYEIKLCNWLILSSPLKQLSWTKDIVIFWCVQLYSLVWYYNVVVHLYSHY